MRQNRLSSWNFSLIVSPEPIDALKTKDVSPSPGQFEGIMAAFRSLNTVTVQDIDFDFTPHSKATQPSKITSLLDTATWDTMTLFLFLFL